MQIARSDGAIIGALQELVDLFLRDLSGHPQLVLVARTDRAIIGVGKELVHHALGQGSGHTKLVQIARSDRAARACLDPLQRRP